MFEVTAKVPLLTVTAPPNVLLPDNVRVPVPCFVIPPLELLPSLWITPENVVEELSPPTVKISLFIISIVPAPEIDPMVSETLTSRVAPEETVTAVLSANLPFTIKVPALTVVSPEWVLTPVKVKVPAPVLVSAPDPVIIPP